MKKSILFIFALLLLSLQVKAQEAETESEETATEETTVAPEKSSRSHWNIGLSSMQWNEALRIQQGLVNDKDAANFNGLAVTLEKDFQYQRWGWSIGGLLGTGRANGGGNSALISYQQSKVTYSILGVTPRGYYRLSGRINVGVTALVFVKKMDWPQDTPGQNIESGRNLNAMPLLDLKIRLFQRWDLYQGVGPLSEGSTLWKIGLHYRF